MCSGGTLRYQVPQACSHSCPSTDSRQGKVLVWSLPLVLSLGLLDASGRERLLGLIGLQISGKVALGPPEAHSGSSSED